MPRKLPWPPKVYTRRGQDYIRIRLGKGRYQDVGLGPAGSAEAREKFVRLLAEMEANHRSLPVKARDEPMVSELLRAYSLEQKSLLEPRGFARVKTALAPVNRLYGLLPAAEFGPVALRTVREQYVAHPYCRRLCNQMAGVVRHCFRWCAAREMIPHVVAAALGDLEPLRKRRTTAHDLPKILPADLDTVELTLLVLPRIVGDMVRLQLLTGMRPGETCVLRPCDLDHGWKTIEGVRLWLYRLDEHKNDWRGHFRWVPIGPKAQALLAGYLEGRDPETYCFRPCDTAREFAEEKGRIYREKRKRAPGVRYATYTYDHCVLRACRRAGVEPWAPNQLRHTVGTAVEDSHGREDARCVLGHKNPTTTAVYCESVERAARVIAQIG